MEWFYIKELSSFKSKIEKYQFEKLAPSFCRIIAVCHVQLNESPRRLAHL